MDFLGDLWIRIDCLVAHKGTTFKVIAKENGLNYQTLKNQKCRGISPKLQDIVVIANALNCSTDYLLTGKEAEALSKEAMAVEFDDKMKAVIRALQRDPHLLEIISAVVISSELHPVGL